jgi:hypothetical protein
MTNYTNWTSCQAVTYAYTYADGLCLGEDVPVPAVTMPTIAANSTRRTSPPWGGGRPRAG